MTKELLPLSMPSSTKTMVGLPESERAPAPQRAQRTLMGAGPEHASAVEAFLTGRSDRTAMAPPAGSERAKKTLLGISEPPPPPPSAPPSRLPLSFEAVVPGPLSLRPSLVSSPALPSQRGSMQSIADLPFERPVIAAAGVAAAVAIWALMVLYLFAM